MSWLYPTLNRWLPTRAPTPVARANPEPFDLPNEIWTSVFEELSLRRDLFAVFTTCHHFNDLILRIYLSRLGDISANVTAGILTLTSDMIPVLNLAIHRPRITRMTCSFDIHVGSRTPRDLKALKTLVTRAPHSVDLRLSFKGDLLSAYQSDLFPLTPQRIITEPFCDLLSVLPREPDHPVVFVGTEIFTSRAADIRSWQLDKYMFVEPSPTKAAGSFFGFLEGLLPFSGAMSKHPPRTKSSIKMHNGLFASVFPFISISSVDIRHPETPLSAEFPSWTLVILNAGSPHWPNVLDLSAPLSAEEWAGILPLLNFPNLPFIRMDPPRGDVSDAPSVPAEALDAFLSRHSAITRMYYFPDLLSIPDAPTFSYVSLPRLRTITTTFFCVLHLFHSPEATFPKLFAIRLMGTDEPRVITEALCLLSHHAGISKLILEVSTGSWMAAGVVDADVVHSLFHVDTVILLGFTDFVDPAAIVEWVKLFPALRRVGLRGCLHDDVDPEERENFALWVREQLSDSIELIST